MVVALFVVFANAVPLAQPAAAALSTDSQYDQVRKDASTAKRLLNEYWSNELPRQFGIRFDLIA